MSVLIHRTTEVLFDAIPGCVIADAAKECIEYISEYNCDILLAFNSVYIPINKWDTVESIISKYHLALNRKDYKYVHFEKVKEE